MPNVHATASFPRLGEEGDDFAHRNEDVSLMR